MQQVMVGLHKHSATDVGRKPHRGVPPLLEDAVAFGEKSFGGTASVPPYEGYLLGT